MKVKEDVKEVDIAEYLPLVRILANKSLQKVQSPMRHLVSYEDLVQTGLMALWKSTNTYDESKGASFKTYAGMKINYAMSDEIRRMSFVNRKLFKPDMDEELRNKLNIANSPVSYEDYDLIYSDHNVEDEVQYQEMCEYLEYLPDHIKERLILRINGLRNHEIGDIVGLTPGRISQNFKFVKAFIKHYLSYESK